MSFRRRMVVLAASAVAVAVVVAAAAVYYVTRDQLRSQLDASLVAKVTPGHAGAVQIKVRASKGGPPPNVVRKLDGAAASAPVPLNLQREGGGSASGAATGSQLAGSTPPAGIALGQGDGIFFASGAVVTKIAAPPPKGGGATGYVQLVDPSNNTFVTSVGKGPKLGVDAAVRAVASGRHAAFFRNTTLGGARVREYVTRPPLAATAGAGSAVLQVALPLTELDSTLSHLRLVLAFVCLGGVGLAAVLGFAVSRAALAPVRRLTHATEQIARTDDLAHRIEATRDDELGQLATSFNTMLAALESSRQAQRRLISDASHELRTPLTSVRANLDALASDALGERERAAAVAAARGQLAELTVLVGDLVDLSRGTVERAELEEVRLDLAVEAAVQRARRHAPGCRFELRAQPCLVSAAPARLDRAVANLLDNACKWTPPGAAVEVAVEGGSVRVRDHGRGIAPADLPRVFDRFYRAPSARGLPGSGLGLAIVRQFAETHGGAASAHNEPTGGAVLTLELPALPWPPSDADVPVPFTKLLAGSQGSFS